MKKLCLLILMTICIMIKTIHISANYILPPSSVYYVYTPNGTPVESLKYQSDMSDDNKQSLISDFNSFEIIGEPTFYYNCHAYAWHIKGEYVPTMSSQSCWIIDPLAYINDNSYDEITMTNISEGDIVTYWKNGTILHSGIVTTESGIINITSMENVYIISKFGEGPLIRHVITNADSYYDSSTIVKFYTRHEHYLVSYSSISATQHSGVCEKCNMIVTGEHNIYQEGLFYKCTECNYQEMFIPIIKNGITYYLFAGDAEQKLRNKDEMTVYLLENNYVELIDVLNIVTS